MNIIMKRKRIMRSSTRSPSGATAWGSSIRVRDRLYRYDLKTGEARVLSPEYGQVEAFWAENGTVFFTCNIYTGKKLPQNGLYEYVEETDTVIRHPEPGDVFHQLRVQTEWPGGILRL